MCTSWWRCLPYHQLQKGTLRLYAATECGRYLIENGVLLVTVSALDELEQIAVCSSCSVDFSDLLSKEPKVTV